jgi:hypothetical protein
MKGIREKWNQIAEHVPRARKAVHQEQFRSVGPTRFAIRNLQAVNVGGKVADRSHKNVPLQTTVVS